MKEMEKTSIDIVRKILMGYGRLIKTSGIIILFLGLFGISALLVVFPTWFFSTNFRPGYNIAVVSIIVVMILTVIVLRIRKGINLPEIARFLLLSFQLAFFLVLLFQENIIMSIIGMAVAFEHIILFCVVKKKESFLSKTPRNILVSASIISAGYTDAVFFVQGKYLLAIPLLVVYLLATGYLLYHENNRY